MLFAMATHENLWSMQWANALDRSSHMAKGQVKQQIVLSVLLITIYQVELLFC